MGLSGAVAQLRCCDLHLSVSRGATRCWYTCIYACVCMWVGQEMTGGVFAIFTNGSLSLTYFPLWSRWCVQVALLPTYRHVSVAAVRWPQRLLSVEHSGSVTAAFCGWGRSGSGMTI